MEDERAVYPEMNGEVVRGRKVVVHGARRPVRWAEELLNQCASAIASNNVVRAQHLMWVLNDLASLNGDANERLAGYGLRALLSRVRAVQGEFIAMAPKAVHKALLKFHDRSPWQQVLYILGNSVLVEALAGKERIHVVDIGVSLGTQWPTLMEALSSREEGPPTLLRITLVMGSGQFEGGTSYLLLCLDRFASMLGLVVQIKSVFGPLDELHLHLADLGAETGEALAVCAQFRLHELSPDVEAGSSPRDSCLRLLRQLNPLLLIFSDNDADHLAADFGSRFCRLTAFFWTFFDSTSAAFVLDGEERQVMEQQAGLMLLNAAACDRAEQNESHGGWASRLQRAGFSNVPISKQVVEISKAILRKYDIHWELAVDMNCALLLWKQQCSTFFSTWNCGDQDVRQVNGAKTPQIDAQVHLKYE